MKSLLKNLSLLSMGLMIYSCNEKISPELQSGNSTTVPTAVAPDEYYFKVTNNSATVLNYKLHRTGTGNAAADCKVASSGVALSSTLYIGQSAIAHDSKTYDISCFMEAEELSLHFNGLSFNVEASKNTCEYIAYSPYSYYDSIPGASSATWSGITCTTPISAANLLLASGIGTIPQGRVSLPAGVLRNIECNEMVDTSIAATDRVIKAIPDNFQTQCAFDYATNDGGNGKNCDTGTMSISLLEVTEVEGSVGPPVVPTTYVATPVSTPNYRCGGKIAACVEGPIRQLAVLDDATGGSHVYSTTLNEDFTTTYDLPGLMGVKPSMHDIVNYRKGLASLDLNFMDFSTGSDANWGDTNYNKSFDPSLMEKFAANRNPDNTYIIDNIGSVSSGFNATVSNATYIAKTIENGVTQVPLAADPFLGTSARINPFYTFYCLDRAWEIKARIRMVVRDWDRVFPSTATEMELISDSYMNVNARRQDLPSNETEVPNDPGSYNYFNDRDDWDVLVEMDRTDPNLVGVYDAGFTQWSPTSGWWSPGIFPNEADD